MTQTTASSSCGWPHVTTHTRCVLCPLHTTSPPLPSHTHTCNHSRRRRRRRRGGGGSRGGGGGGEMRAIPHDAQRDTRGHARGVQRKSVSASQMQVSPLPTALSKMPAEVTPQPVACPCLSPCAPPCSPFLMISRSCPSLPSLAPTQRSFSTMRFDAISLFLPRRALSSPCAPAVGSYACFC